MIGREYEKNLLLRAYKSEYSEFVAIYGRRRVGKTFLIRETFNYTFTFQHAGLKKKKTAIQLERFQRSLIESGYKECPELKNWYAAFDALKEVIVRSQDKKKLIFIDEMPWMDRPNANFISALENFWNAWASARKDILLIICGSAASWVLKKIVHNTEGLHNRVTYRIPLRPFTLKECEAYAESLGLGFNRRQIAECYMILGGIPYYWHFLEKGLSVAQNIDELFFAGHDKLEEEFDELYASLFQSPGPYIAIVEALATKRIGMTRDEICHEANLVNGGKLTDCLKDLERCGFVRSYSAIGKCIKGTVYQLIDNYTLFYYTYVARNRNREKLFWSKQYGKPMYNTWAGLAFERLCLLHADEIKESLRIGAVNANVNAWRNAAAQIDLLIDRADGIIDICEMKFANDEFELTATTDRDMRRKKSEFQKDTETKKSLHVVYVTTYGLADNSYAKDVQASLSLDALFR